MRYKTFQKDRGCRQIQSGLLSGCCKFPKDMAEAALSQQDTNDLEKECLVIISSLWFLYSAGYCVLPLSSPAGQIEGS